MPVARIERIVGGTVRASAARDASGRYIGHLFGSNVDPVPLATLDDVAAFLKSNPKSGVRMNPGWTKISRNVHIDGILLR